MRSAISCLCLCLSLLAGPGAAEARAQGVTWTAGTSLSIARALHTATLLPDGRVLVAGGRGSSVASAVLDSVELYDAGAGGWSATGSLAVASYLHTATLLPSGNVLLAGGASGGVSGFLSRSELYDPGTGSWSATGAMAAARFQHTATLLPSGKVLIAGGFDGGGTLSSVELYDPTTGRWSATGALATGRADHTATLLPSGKVLVAGGFGTGHGIMSSAEIYDPGTGTWSTTGALTAARQIHSATLLPGGEVLVAGGFARGGGTLGSAELYDPATGSWVLTGAMAAGRVDHTATLLPDGSVIVAGGSASTATASVELYDAGTGSWRSTGGLAAERTQHTATLLPSGKLLVAGGFGNTSSGTLSSTELYDASVGSWSATGAMAVARYLHTATLLPSGKVLVAGGHGIARSAELYDPSTGSWSPTGAPAVPRDGHTATLLPGGKVLIAGGEDELGGLPTYRASAELYDPGAGSWSATSAMAGAHVRHTATLLPGGSVLVAGGHGDFGTSSGAELYDPGAGSWSFAGSLATPRERHTATLLLSGKVLVTGGEDPNSSALSSAEVYDPGTGDWSATGSMAAARFDHSATLLPGGKVLVVGGIGVTTTAELYDPGTGRWSTTGALTIDRYLHTATLLPSGELLVAAGFASISAERYDPSTGRGSATGSLAAARRFHTATLLPSGQVMVVGGLGSSGTLSSAELYDEGRGAQAAWTPTLDGPLPASAPGAGLSITGSFFTGVSEAAQGNVQSSATNFPLLLLEREGSEAVAYAAVTEWTATSASAVIPATLQDGWSWARIISNGVASATQPILIAPSHKATPAIAWTTPAAITYGTALSALQLDASANVAGSFAYNPPLGAILTAGPQPLSTIFTPTDTADYNPATATITISVNQATPSIAWTTPAAITYGTALSAAQLDASANVAGSFAYNPPLGTLLTAGTQPLSTTFTPTDATDYNPASATITISVNQATPSIAWTTPAAITYGPALSAAQLDASANVAGSFAYNPPLGTLLTAGTQPLSTTFTPTDATDYNPASATITISVNKATPSIAWTTPAAITYGTALSAAQLDASANVAGSFAYNPPLGTILTAGTEPLSTTFTPTDATDYNPASATITISVNQATPSIAWTTPAAITYGTALSAAQLDASANVAGSFAYNPPLGTILTAGPQSLSTTFTPTDTTDYNPASATITISVNQATPSIAWTTPAAITYGTALSAAQLDASANVAGSFAYNPPLGTILTAGAQPLSTTFTPTDTTDYNPASATITISVNKATPSIAWTTPADITYGTALSATQLDAAANVPGAFAYSPPAGTLLNTGANQTLSVIFTPADATDFTDASASVSTSVLKATPLIAWANPAPITYGTRLSSTQLDASASIPGAFAYAPGAGTVLNVGANQTLSATFTPADTGHYATVTRSVTISVTAPAPNAAGPSSSGGGGGCGFDARGGAPGSLLPVAALLLGLALARTISAGPRLQGRAGVCPP